MLDRGTKIYAAVLGALVLVAVFAVLYESPKVSALNRMLAEDPELSGYAYPFRVLRIEGATAVMGTPRSAAVPVQRMIGAIEPGLAGRGGDDPDFQRAQQRLADLQAHARARVLADPDITAVRWELDADWLRARGIDVPPAAL